MQLKDTQLEDHLKKQIAACYLISGDEPYLHQQACDAIRHAAKASGYLERKIFYQESGFDYSELATELNSLSLFADKKIIELRSAKNNLDKAATQVLQSFFDSRNNDICLLITMPKISASNKRSSWFKIIDAHAISVQVWPLKQHQMPHWLKSYCEKKQLKISEQAIRFICETNQGNLLAATQTLEKIALLFDRETFIDLHDIQSQSHQNSIFNSFDLSAAYLKGEKIVTNQQLQQLRSSGTEISIILWVLLKDIRLVTKLFASLQQGKNPAQLINKYYLPEQQKKSVLAALNRINQKHIHKFFHHALEIERAIKGSSAKDAWLLLERLLLA